MQTLYYGGTILTMKAEDDCTDALLEEDGRILFTGSLSDARARMATDTRMVDLNGRTLMPSFIDGHGHIMMAAQYADFSDLSACTSFADIVSTLKEYKEKHHIDENSVLLGQGYDHNFLTEGRHPNRELLDQVSQTIPIYIFHNSGHMGVANSALLSLIGITKDTEDPSGGKYGRYPDSREPDGYVEEIPALIPVISACYGRLHMNMEDNIRKIQEMYLSYGVTTVQDGATSQESAAQLISFAEKGSLTLDVVSYIMAAEKPEEFFQKHKDYFKKYSRHLKFNGAKAVLDGSPQGKSAWLSTPYEGEESYRGYPAMTDEEISRQALYCINHNLQLLAHCNGDAAGDQFLNAYEKALQLSDNPQKENLRPVMIHCQTIRKDQLTHMAALSMIPSIFIGHVYYWGDIHRKNLGEQRADQISLAKSALGEGLIINFHQDTPVTRPDMLHTIWCAVNRITRTGHLLGGSERISAFEAIQAVTLNPAYAYFEEESKGTLEPGKLADMVILDKNPLAVPPMEIKDISVLETIKEGKSLYRKGV